MSGANYLDLWAGSFPLPPAQNAIPPDDLVKVMTDIIRIDLPANEAPARPGGHTIARHIGLTDQQLKDRLINEGKPRISGFDGDVAFVEAIIVKALLSNLHQVYNWFTAPTNTYVVVKFRNNFSIGRAFIKPADGVSPPQRTICYGVCVRLDYGVIHAGTIFRRDKFILTAYPI